MGSAKPYLSLVAHYESCLEQHGDTHLGVDWPKADDVDVRHEVMLGVLGQGRAEETSRVLDFGCGASHLYEYIVARGIDGIEYCGLDLSQRFVELSRSKFPHNEYHCVDILDDGIAIPRSDYVVMNGVFTLKRELSFEQMFAYLRDVLRRVFAIAEVGIAFNVMSKHVDWERDDLFHLPFDVLAGFLTQEITRDFVFRNDYGLYEYTTYAYRR